MPPNLMMLWWRSEEAARGCHINGEYYPVLVKKKAWA
jgi:hypothetical protein